jgi:hypothetical protein
LAEPVEGFPEFTNKVHLTKSDETRRLAKTNFSLDVTIEKGGFDVKEVNKSSMLVNIGDDETHCGPFDNGRKGVLVVNGVSLLIAASN